MSQFSVVRVCASAHLKDFRCLAPKRQLGRFVSVFESLSCEQKSGVLACAVGNYIRTVVLANNLTAPVELLFNAPTSQ
jgi:hypothetical protein